MSCSVLLQETRRFSRTHASSLYVHILNHRENKTQCIDSPMSHRHDLRLTARWAVRGCRWGCSPGELSHQTCQSCCWRPPAMASFWTKIIRSILASKLPQTLRCVITLMSPPPSHVNWAFSSQRHSRVQMYFISSPMNLEKLSGILFLSETKNKGGQEEPAVCIKTKTVKSFKHRCVHRVQISEKMDAPRKTVCSYKMLQM